MSHDHNHDHARLFYVVEVNRDMRNRIAHPGLLQEAIESVQPDLGDILRYGIVSAPDAGAARLTTPPRWEDVPYWARASRGYGHLKSRKQTRASAGELCGTLSPLDGP